MALHLYSSNKLEDLAEKLIEELKKPQTRTKSSLFQKEIIVSQSKGMEKWLSLYIADKTGISANIRFPFPKAFIYDELFSAVLNLQERPVNYQPEIMAWKIMGALPALISRDKSGDFNAPKSYLSGSKSGAGTSDNKLKLYQLSNRIANVFDQYMVYRPEMLLNGWKNNGFSKASDSSKAEWDKKARWQKILFEVISEDSEALMPSKLCFDFISRLNPEENKDFKNPIIQMRRVVKQQNGSLVAVIVHIFVMIRQSFYERLNGNKKFFLVEADRDKYFGNIAAAKPKIRTNIKT